MHNALLDIPSFVSFADCLDCLLQEFIFKFDDTTNRHRGKNYSLGKLFNHTSTSTFSGNLVNPCANGINICSKVLII